MTCGDIDALNPHGVLTVILYNWNFKAISIDYITVLLGSLNIEIFQIRKLFYQTF